VTGEQGHHGVESFAPGQAVTRIEISLADPETASDFMTTDVRSAPPDATLRRIAEIMREENVGIVPIIDEDAHLLGVVTDRDIVVRADARGLKCEDVRARDVMTRHVETARADDDIHEVLERMGEIGVHRIPILDQGQRLLGVVSLADVARRADLPLEVQETLDRIARHQAS
jgi:CBS domain-containing protein